MIERRYITRDEPLGLLADVSHQQNYPIIRNKIVSTKKEYVKLLGRIDM